MEDATNATLLSESDSVTPSSKGRPYRRSSSDSPTLEIRLLGKLELRSGTTSLPQFESARAESLLAYLLLHRDAAQPRQHLAFLLWPDSTEAQAQTNLRHVLHNLRRALPEADHYLEVGPRTLRWRTPVPFRLDVAAFEDAIALADATAPDDAVEALRDAVDAYGGDLLEGCYDEWLLDERERLSQLHLGALNRLAELLEGRNEYAQAIPYAERLLSHDPLREQTYRLLMRLFDGLGDRARALRVYHACAATLERELGIEPASATRDVYEALLQAEPPPADRERKGGRLPGPALVGRASERAQLSTLWRASEQGRAQVVLVTGEPGIGKTRLVEELRSWCAHLGAMTAEARSYFAEGALAYGPVVAWLRSEALSDRRDRVDRAALSELGRLLPELAEEPELASPRPLSPSERRQRLFDALVRAILASNAPLLLVADDVQWADTETLQFLHYLLRSEPEAQILVAMTARSEELDRNHQLNDLLVGLRSLERLTELELQPLSQQETTVLAERLARRPFAEPVAELLYSDTEGNPLFVVETLRAGWTGEQRERGPITPRVQAAIESRLAQLSSAARELVEVAATIGREFSSNLLAAAGGIEAEALVSGLDELWRRRIIREQGSKSYDFSHDKIREVVDLGLGPARRRQLHLRVAAALEHLHAADPSSVSAQLASHYDRAAATEEAVRWYVIAAEAAQRLYADAEAARLLERALELARGMSAGTDRDELELRLLTALPAPLVAVEGYLSARVVVLHERALECAGALGVEPEAPLVRSLALANLARGDFEAASNFGEQLGARGEREEDDVLLVESAYVLGVAAYWQGRLAAARAHFETAVERCRPGQWVEHLLRYAQDPEVVCLTRLAHTLWLLGHDEEAGRTRDAGLALADERGHPYSRAVGGVWAAVLALDQRDEGRLRGYVEILKTTDPAHGPAQHRLAVEALAGFVEVLDGHTNEGLERVGRAVEDARSGEPAAPGFHVTLTRILLEAQANARSHQAGLTTADEALAMGAGAQLWEAEMRRLRAEFLAALGAERNEVEAELERGFEVAEHQGSRSFAARARVSLDRLYAGTL